MRLLGVGTPKAARLVRLAGWASPGPCRRSRRPAPQPPGPLHLVTDRATPGPRLRRRNDHAAILYGLWIGLMTTIVPRHRADSYEIRHTERPRSSQPSTPSVSRLSEQEPSRAVHT